MKYCLYLLLILCIGSGCTSRRSGYAVDVDTHPLTEGQSYREIVQHIGNPMRVRTLPEGGFEAIWIGSATTGGSFQVSYFGIRFSLGRVQTETIGRRMYFDKHGKLTASFPIGQGAPAWSVVPFGKR